MPGVDSIEVVNRQIAEAAWSHGDWETVDRLVSEDYVTHGCFGEEGREEFKQRIAEFRTAFPDQQRTRDSLVVRDDKVVTCLTLTGSHLGVYRGIAPTGRRIKLTGIVIDRIVGGRRVESWVQYDMLGLLTQLGARLEPG